MPCCGDPCADHGRHAGGEDSLAVLIVAVVRLLAFDVRSGRRDCHDSGL